MATIETLRLEPGSPLARLDWGQQVTGETVRRLAEDAAVTPVLVDSDGKVLHVGRRSRTVTTRQRKALNLRDGHCQYPGCKVDANECTPDHIIPWAAGGPTELGNLRLLCQAHHRERHPENSRFYRPP